MKKIICLLLVACTLVTFAACNSSDTPDTQVDESAADTSGADNTNSEDIAIAKDGAPLFCVVYQDTENADIAMSFCELLGLKVGVEFQCLRFAPDGTRCIYIGYDDKKLELEDVKVTFGGYAIVQKDGNIYFCGKTTRALADATDTFVSSIVPKEHITKDENGKTLLAVAPKQAFKVFNPDYIVSNPTLLSAHVSEYSIVIPKDADSVRTRQAGLLNQQIATLTGFELDVVTDDKPAAEREIVLGSTSRKTLDALDSEYGYCIKGDGTRVFLNFGSDYAFDAIYDRLRDMFGQDTLDISGSSTLDYYKREGDIRILSYNVWYGIPSGYKSAEKYEGIAALVRQLAPDFMGMQEAQDWYVSISDLLSDEYGVISQTKGYIPILYRKDTWKPAEDAEGNIIKSCLKFDKGDLWGYEWVMFERVDDPSVKVIMGNLHFCNTNEGPEWAYREERPEQMKAFKAEVKRLEVQYEGIPMFFTGDYNTQTTMTGDEKYEDGWQHIVGDTKLETGMLLTEDSNKYNAIDHVCTNGELVEVIRHRRVSYKVMQELSDHLPVFIDVRIK